MSDAGHITACVLATVVDAGVLQASERQLKELASAKGHRLRIFEGNSEFYMVEVGYVLQKRSGINIDWTRTVVSETILTRLHEIAQEESGMHVPFRVESF